MTKTKVTRPDATPAGGRPRRTRPPAAARGARPAADPHGEASQPPRRRAAPRLPRTIVGTVQVALEKKAEDVVVLDLRRAGGFTDYFVICTGANARQIAAIADAVRQSLARDFAERPALTEGADRSEWILLDYFDFVVHIFSRDCRTFYGLERLWGNAVRHEFAAAERPARP